MLACVNLRCRISQMCHMFQSSYGRKYMHNLRMMKAESARRISRCPSSIGSHKGIGTLYH